MCSLAIVALSVGACGGTAPKGIERRRMYSPEQMCFFSRVYTSARSWTDVPLGTLPGRASAKSERLGT